MPTDRSGRECLGGYWGPVRLGADGLFPDTFLKSCDQLVRRKVANGRIIGGGAREAELGLEFWEHDRLDPPD